MAWILLLHSVCLRRLLRPCHRKAQPAPRCSSLPWCWRRAVVAFAGLSFSRKAQTFQPLGFEGVDRGAFWQVTSVETLDSFLQSGDQILLVNGQEYGELADPARLLRRHSTSELVVLREGEMVAVTYALPSLE